MAAGKNISASLMQKSLNTSILSADSILRTTFLKNLVRLRGELDKVSKTRTEGMTHVAIKKEPGISSSPSLYEEVYLREYKTFNDAYDNVKGFIEDAYNEKRLHSSKGG